MACDWRGLDLDVYFGEASRIKYKSRWKQVGTQCKRGAEWRDGERTRSELLVALICLYRD